MEVTIKLAFTKLAKIKVSQEQVPKQYSHAAGISLDKSKSFGKEFGVRE